MTSAVEAKQRGGDERLDEEQGDGRADQFGPVGDERDEVDAHADGDQENTQRKPAQGGGDGLDLRVIFGFGNEDSGDHGAEDRRQADRAGGEAGEDDDQQADGKEQLGALGACRLGEQAREEEAPADEERRHDQHAADRGPHEAGERGVTAHHFEQEEQGDERKILEQEHGEGGLADRALGPGDGQDERGRGEGEREAKRDRTADPLAERQHADGDEPGGEKEFGGADPEHRAAHGGKAAEAEVESGGEEEEDDPELGKRLDPLRVGDREGFQPRMGLRHRAERERPGDDPDENEADDGRHFEPGEGRNDDPRREEHGQRVGEAGAAEMIGGRHGDA